jgi:hypothetical protein
MGGRRQLFDFTSPIFGGTCLHVAANETTRHGIGCNGSSTSGCRDRVPYILGRENALTSYTQGGSPVPKSGSLGSVRGAGSNACPYRENRLRPIEMMQTLSKPRVVLGLRDELGEISADRPSGSRWKGGASSAHRLCHRTRELWPLAMKGNDKRCRPRGRIPMRKASSRATDSSEETSVMGVERCGGVVWELKRTNSGTRMRP